MRVDVNGQQPPILGMRCEGLVALEYAYRGEIVEPANDVYMRFSGRWHRMYFDFSTIFWRTTERDEEPNGYEAPEIDGTWRPIDLARQFGVLGLALEQIVERNVDGGVAVDLVFEKGRR
jgi:hypothetical protein